MGAPYRVTIKHAVKEVASAEDEYVVRMDPGRGLSQAETAEATAQVLEERGWTQTGPGTYEQDLGNGAKRTFDVSSMEAKIEASASEEVEASDEVEVSLGDYGSGRCGSANPCANCPFRKPMSEADREAKVAAAEQALAERLGDEAAEKRAEREEALATSVAKEIESRVEATRHEVEMISRGVTAKGLGKRARELGAVVDVSESGADDNEYELVIQIVERSGGSSPLLPTPTGRRSVVWNPGDEDRDEARTSAGGQAKPYRGPVTFEWAVSARHGDVVYHVVGRYADGTASRYRVTGKCQTWKTRPGEFRLPIKHGLRTHYEVSHLNADDWLTYDPTRAETNPGDEDRDEARASAGGPEKPYRGPYYRGPVTLEWAITARRGTEVWYVTTRGDTKRYLTTGKCKTWRTKPDAFELPVKHESDDERGAVTHEVAENWFTYDPMPLDDCSCGDDQDPDGPDFDPFCPLHGDYDDTDDVSDEELSDNPGDEDRDEARAASSGKCRHERAKRPRKDGGCVCRTCGKVVDPTPRTLCLHCDHFVEEEWPDPGANQVAYWVHLEDGDQEFDHAAEPGPETRPDWEWAELRPDLFKEHPDGNVGPNSMWHSRRGKIDHDDCSCAGQDPDGEGYDPLCPLHGSNHHGEDYSGNPGDEDRDEARASTVGRWSGGPKKITVQPHALGRGGRRFKTRWKILADSVQLDGIDLRLSIGGWRIVFHYSPHERCWGTAFSAAFAGEALTGPLAPGEAAVGHYVWFDFEVPAGLLIHMDAPGLVLDRSVYNYGRSAFLGFSVYHYAGGASMPSCGVTPGNRRSGAVGQWFPGLTRHYGIGGPMWAGQRRRGGRVHVPDERWEAKSITFDVVEPPLMSANAGDEDRDEARASSSSANLAYYGVWTPRAEVICLGHIDDGVRPEPDDLSKIFEGHVVTTCDRCSRRIHLSNMKVVAEHELMLDLKKFEIHGISEIRMAQTGGMCSAVNVFLAGQARPILIVEDESEDGVWHSGIDTSFVGEAPVRAEVTCELSNVSRGEVIAAITQAGAQAAAYEAERQARFMREAAENVEPKKNPGDEDRDEARASAGQFNSIEQSVRAMGHGDVLLHEIRIGSYVFEINAEVDRACTAWFDVDHSSVGNRRVINGLRASLEDLRDRDAFTEKVLRSWGLEDRLPPVRRADSIPGPVRMRIVHEVLLLLEALHDTGRLPGRKS